MKTLKEWQDSNLDFNKYCPLPSEVDEGLHQYFMDVVQPNYYTAYEDPIDIFQVGEAQTSKDDVFYFSTFSKVEDKFFYLGDLPDMNLIEKEPEEIETHCDFCSHNF